MGNVSTSLAKISSAVCSCSVSVAVGNPLSMSTVPDFAFLSTGVSRGEMVACEGEGEWADVGVFSMVEFERRPSLYSCGLVCWRVGRKLRSDVGRVVWIGCSKEQERDSESGKSKQSKKRKTQRQLTQEVINTTLPFVPAAKAEVCPVHLPTCLNLIRLFWIWRIAAKFGAQKADSPHTTKDRSKLRRACVKERIWFGS